MTTSLHPTAVFVTDDVDWDSRLDDEVHVWNVYVGDDDGEPIGKTYTVCRGRESAIALGERIARDRHLELVVD